MTKQYQQMIQVEDQRLMALLKTNPPVGEEVSFSVEQLYPHIVLKELSKFNELNTYIWLIRKSFTWLRKNNRFKPVYS